MYPDVIVAVGDTTSSRTVYAIVVALVVIGIVFAGLAVWLLKRTKVDAALLAPLELMDDRRWRSKDPATQRRLLDDARPEGAEPLRPAWEEPRVDPDFGASDQPVPSFDDLAAVAVAAPAADAADAAEGEADVDPAGIPLTVPDGADEDVAETVLAPTDQAAEDHDSLAHADDEVPVVDTESTVGVDAETSSEAGMAGSGAAVVDAETDPPTELGNETSSEDDTVTESGALVVDVDSDPIVGVGGEMPSLGDISPIGETVDEPRGSASDVEAEIRADGADTTFGPDVHDTDVDEEPKGSAAEQVVVVDGQPSDAPEAEQTA